MRKDAGGNQGEAAGGERKAAGGERKARKIVKLRFDTGIIRTAVKEARKVAHGRWEGEKETWGGGGTGLGGEEDELVLCLSRPTNDKPDLPAPQGQGSLVGGEVSRVQGPLANPSTFENRTLTRESQMNLDEKELKYLRVLVLNKYRDVNAEKHHRSRQRYGW